jgi:eukaryotic-like serine/threonine-protein kinase
VIHGGVNVGGVWHDSEPTVAANSTSYTWGGLSPGTQVCYIIWASNAAGNSDYFAAGQDWVCATTLQS